MFGFGKKDDFERDLLFLSLCSLVFGYLIGSRKRENKRERISTLR